MAHIFRFADNTRRLRQRIAAGEIGSVVFARSEFQVDAFADAVEGRAAFPVPGEEGWKNQVILDAALSQHEDRADGNHPIG
jgi:predicted dehydrogenase